MRTMARLLPLLATIAGAGTALSAPGGAPDLLWLTSPTLPSQTLVAVYTSATPNATTTATVRLCHGAQLPAAAPSARCVGTEATPPVAAGDGLSAMVAVPGSWPLAVYAAQVCRGDAACSMWSTINDADPLWAQADRGTVATRGPTGWLRVFGRSLAFGTRCVDVEALAASTISSVRLVSGTGASVVLTHAAQGSCYDLAAPVPATVPLGRYTVQVKNGLPGSSWVPTSDSQQITVVAPEPPPAHKFPVKGGTGRDVALALAAAGAAGGGMVELTPGHVYHMTTADSLFVPDGVTLTTASR